ncbi:C-X-C chemokine receptor type 5 isoform X1 [Rhincodon typus]|uniref:C-X-C chemokine receptor type 5 isoform X1 n=1 Tax=Rhincodon typus TaxID=259920 RepID=UPI0009A37CF4|nr:C-X-C chemokine receptor type 5 isoform X1 [Rhincodon typus]
MSEMRFNMENLTNMVFSDFDYLYDNVTDDFDYEETYCPEEDETPKYFRKVIVPMLYFIVFLFGIIGNGLVLLILLRYRHMRTPTDNYLLHLAMADLLLVLVLPFFAVEKILGWHFSTFLCKVIGSIHKLNFFCNSLLLGCISFDRYLAIVYAVQTYKKRKAQYVHLVCSAIWSIGFILQIPTLVFLTIEENLPEDIPKCTYPSSDIRVNDWLLAEQILYHGIGFSLPLVVMCYCYTKVIQTLCKTQNFERHKAVKMVLTVTVMFFICWSPYNVVMIIRTLRSLDVFTAGCDLYRKLAFAMALSESVGFSHSCLNPILYVFIGVKFRNDILKLLREMGCISQATMDSHFHLKRAGKNGNPSVSDYTTSWSNV